MVIEFLKEIDHFANSITNKRTNDINKELNEQFFTPIQIAYYMSSMFKPTNKSEIDFMDTGAGVGNLTASFIAYVCSWKRKPKKINATLYEIDPTLINELKVNIESCSELCIKNNINLEVKINNEDFIESSVKNLTKDHFELYDFIILNPPYKKLNTNSTHKKLLSRIGIDVPNYYAAFVSLSYRLLKDNAQLVCITPRSFCNGQYFKSFRIDIQRHVRIEKIHLFGSRKDLFVDDVLQETMIMMVTRNIQRLNDNIDITESIDHDFANSSKVKKRFDNVIFPHDQEKIIRIIKGDDLSIVDRMHSLPCTLEQLGIDISTGPVVDFRENQDLLLYEGTLFTIPIIYPENFSNGFIQWPITGKKPCYLIEDETNSKKLRPPGIYVLVKRISSKEERKRIVAAIYDSHNISNTNVAFENKVNYFHIKKKGLNSKALAKGLSLYLNSSIVDFYFRTFSGSTQVNVSDLKSLKYPSSQCLEIIGESYNEELPSQETIDQIINQILF
ncbi:Eco57I restriction-modification methylase domain-containing protein [Bacillus toyonensis]|uniref:Eco57I restriction-modification methylase domain-containing protein n=1 Tax=Bacillus toyonensis TaxID=155322 RepID=UPI002404E9E0|nr:Eco57I restriction-modification methylase domain-containing protein [Bacillus toyonensis]MDF9450945.1 Eco57I restriction-modification methylase domain-containing protein [Bacillus toyonensis]MDG1565215.1 Eco57I restriction-modification methylase domain-containing protein [Bacillus toyonensis]